MLTAETTAAVLRLQQAARWKTDIYWQERIDRALDECVQYPQRTAAASHQSRSALANARKVLDRRRAIRAFVSLEQVAEDVTTAPLPGRTDPGYDIVEALCWIETSPRLSHGDRALLRLLALGHDPESLAAEYGVPIARMRERISRARRAAGSARRGEMAS